MRSSLLSYWTSRHIAWYLFHWNISHIRIIDGPCFSPSSSHVFGQDLASSQKSGLASIILTWHYVVLECDLMLINDICHSIYLHTYWLFESVLWLTLLPLLVLYLHSMSWAQSFRAGSTESSATSDTIQVIFFLSRHCVVAMVVLFSKHQGISWLTSNIWFSPPRKTPVQIFYSSRLDRRPQSTGPTKVPPVVSQLPPGFHQLYSQIEYECASPYYQHHGSSRRTCLKTGKWSGRHVSCSPGEGSRAPEHENWPTD